MISALYIEPAGCYANLDGMDTWDEKRDARRYAGPHPVIAHPPCQRWGKFWHGSTRKPHQFKLGEDQGCFASALASVRSYGGVLEHPADSHAWAFFGLRRPKRGEGWVKADEYGGWTCYVEQGHYGHLSRKPTWLYAAHCDLIPLNWSKLPQRLHPVALERYGYEKARRIGMMAMVGGKDKTKIRNATPIEFRDLLIRIAKTADPSREKIAEAVSAFVHEERKPLTKLQKARMFAEHGGRCCVCGELIDAVRERGFIDEHIIALENGGTNDMKNRGPAHKRCARSKTADDHGLSAKSKRIYANHIGAKSDKGKKMPFGRSSPYKRKLNGQVVLRERGA